ECQPYYWAPSGQASSQFPTNWQPAQIVNGDQDAENLWNSIQSVVPSDVEVKGTQPASLMGDFSGYNYASDDPDCWWTYSKCDTPKHQGIPADIITVPEPDTLGYGFDDGPNCSHNAFYDFLESKNQKATMFYIGSNVQNWPLQAQRAVTDGHQICVHTWSHRYMTSLTSEEVFAEFYYTKKMINLVTGVTPLCWRPPYGDVDDRVRAIANALNLSTIVWQSDSFDWEAGTDGYTDQMVYDNYDTLIAQAQNGTFSSQGTIMLTHELNNFTMQTAVDYYDKLAGAFKHLVPIAVGYNQTDPYVESNVTLPTFEQCMFSSVVVAILRTLTIPRI
ncbi:carbohydrate esterase family 4 protein, partial [Coniophora puteana RWD-64-598 SS2]